MTEGSGVTFTKTPKVSDPIASLDDTIVIDWIPVPDPVYEAVTPTFRIDKARTNALWRQMDESYSGHPHPDRVTHRIPRRLTTEEVQTLITQTAMQRLTGEPFAPYTLTYDPMDGMWSSRALPTPSTSRPSTVTNRGISNPIPRTSSSRSSDQISAEPSSRKTRSKTKL
jgi:hypothetical protein